MSELKITYSWGDEDSSIECSSKEDAWKKALKMAIKEAEISGTEHDCEIGLSFNKEDGKITLHYTYDNEYCYYSIS